MFGPLAGTVFIINFAVAKLHNGKQVGAHGIPHHLINGGDFGFLEGIPENRRGEWTERSFVWSLCPCCHRIFVVLAPL